MKHILKLFISIILCGTIVTLSDCSNRILDFTLISTKNVDLTKGMAFKRGVKRVKGVDKAHWIIIIPTRSVSIKEAVDKAIECTPGCVALLDGVIYTKFWWIPWIYGQQSALIEGTPLIDSTIADNIGEIPVYGRIELDQKGAVKAIESISPDEFIAYKNKMTKGSREKAFVHSKEIGQ